MTPAPVPPNCDLCGDTSAAMFLHTRCHSTAPLMARKEGDELILSCYLPECGREVVRLKLQEASAGVPPTPLSDQAERIFEAVVHTYESDDHLVPEDLREASFVKRARRFRANRHCHHRCRCLHDFVHRVGDCDVTDLRPDPKPAPWWAFWR